MTYNNFATGEFADQVCSPPVELQAADIDDLAKFLTSVFGGVLSVWRECFVHWWDLNPARQAAIPRGWLVRSAGGVPIAFTANIPFRYVIGGRSALCCTTGSTAVDHDWRGLGVAKTVGRAFIEQPNTDLLVGTDSTPAGFQLWRSLGMQSLLEPWLNTNFRIIADGVVAADATSQRFGLSSDIGKAVGYCLAHWLDVASVVVRPSKSLSIERIDSFMKADEGALELCRASNASTYSWRDIETLNWLYFGSPYVSRTRIVLAARSGRNLLGYLAMKQWHEHSYYLLECRCQNADPDVARQLIWAARELAQSNHAQSIIIRPYSRMIEEAIPRAVTVKLASPRMTFCYKFKVGDILLDEWEASPGDGDVSVN